MSASYYVTDHWTGEDYGSVSVHPNYRENPIVEGSWQGIYAVQVAAHQLNGRMSADEIFAGMALGRYSEVDSDAPDPEEMATSKGHTTAVADGLSVVANQQSGITKFQHIDSYFLQKNDVGNYRVIIMVQYGGVLPGMHYQTITGRHPANPGFHLRPHP
ncbi:MAG: hypothetical protein GY746_11300 [Gammaproteobacteria bacterium]|nr:hypothetical protein [Gammaproteobacteria bacterium]